MREKRKTTDAYDDKGAGVLKDEKSQPSHLEEKR
jgi:hypothetical protein